MNRCLFQINLLLIIALSFLSSCHKKEVPLFNEEKMVELCRNVATIADTAEVYFYASETIEQMIDHFDEIKAIEGVEDIYADGDVVYLSIKNWGTLAYNFYFDASVPDEDSKVVSNALESLDDDDLIRTRSILGAGRVCIMNAQHQERAWTHEVVKTTEKMFRSCGFDDVKIENYPSLSFYQREIYNYDLIFIIGHGAYSSTTGLHWLETSEEFIPDDLLERYESFGILPTNPYPNNQVILSISKKDRNNNDIIRQGKKGTVYQYYISEDFITSSQAEFSEKGKAVIFVVPCQSLMGNSNSSDDRPVDTSLADAFFEKGAGLYIGYDESSCWNAQKGGMRFFGRLLSGYSFREAINLLPDEYKLHDHLIRDGWERDYVVEMHVLTSNGFRTSSFLTSPRLALLDDSSPDGYHFTGQAYYCPSVTSSTFDERFDFVDQNRIKYGFRISRSLDITTGKMYEANPSWEHDVATDSYLMSFKLDLNVKDLAQDVKYYAWPYMANGQEINYGERFDFTTKRINRVIPEEIIDQMDDYIPIYEGNNPPNVEGQYLLSPSELVYDSTHGFNIGYIFDDLYFQFLNQDMDNNTLDYVEEQGNSSQVGTGAFISGEGDRFSVFFNTDGNAVYDDYSFWYKTALVISGIKTAEGIKELDYAFVMVDKGDDPKPYFIPSGSFRVFKDGDGLSTNTNYFSRRTSAPLKPMSYNPTPLPSMFEVEHN